MKVLVKIVCVFGSLIISGVVLAQTKVVVIPLMGGGAENLKNVITVSKENGDFTNPIDAINSIPITGDDAPSFFNSYLIVIGPGYYNLSENQLVMRQWVNIAGSGQNSTVIKGTANSLEAESSAAVVVGASNANLTDMTIQNFATGQRSIVIFNDAASPRIERVTARASGRGANYSIYNANNSHPAITNVEAINTTPAVLNYGIYNISSNPTLKNVRISVQNGTSGNIALFIESNSSPKILNSEIFSTITAIYLSSNSSQTRITNSKLMASLRTMLVASSA
jgi:hypothetical protein